VTGAEEVLRIREVRLMMGVQDASQMQDLDISLRAKTLLLGFAVQDMAA
jgi:hypothetical protein